MRKNIFIALTATVLGLAIYHLYVHYTWYKEYLQEFPVEASNEMAPLLINSLLILPSLLMLLVLVKRRRITNLLFYGSTISTAMFAGGIYSALHSDDPVGGGLMLIVVSFPAAIVLSILSAQRLVEGKARPK